jgi:integrase
VRQHFAALPWQEVPSFIASVGEVLKASEKVRLAIEFTVLTAARSGEVRGSRWSEFNLEEAVWQVPAERMKAGRPHRV